MPTESYNIVVFLQRLFSLTEYGQVRALDIIVRRRAQPSTRAVMVRAPTSSVRKVGAVPEFWASITLNGSSENYQNVSVMNGDVNNTSLVQRAVI